MLLLRACLFYLGYWITLIFFGGISFILFFLPQKIASHTVLGWNRFVLWWLKICCGVTFSLSGNVKPLPTPCVVVANHQSPWETIFLQLQLFPLSTVLKKELLNIPFFGWGMRVLKPIAIDRSKPTQSLKQIKRLGLERLEQGYNILIFPEGTRMPVDDLGSFMRSGADIAKQANVPLVAIAHDGGRYWLNKKTIKYPGKVNVTISEPIDVSNRNTKEVMQDVRDWIELQLNS